MTRDPVCRMQIKEGDVTETREFLGKTYYFCSKRCKETFDKDPAKYAHKEDGDTGGHQH